METLEALLSLLFLLLLLAMLTPKPTAPNTALYHAMLQEDANNVFYVVGGFSNPIGAVARFKKAGICVNIGIKDGAPFITSVKQCGGR